eukprot:Phypoly_transcript_21352.p1 GENE.Phypoly_transcript_21352~~Phypoly_transcript_21352.p1  ORF type:complete len:164 (+),score=30.99 Phypoly_transcript_21352:32-493(+)
MAAKCNCGSTQNLQVCSGCKGIFYCSKEHQKSDWKAHKPLCTKIQQAATQGVVKETTTEGEKSKVPKPKQKVTVSYVGKFLNGHIFDQSEEFSFMLGAGQVIKGWDTGIGQLCKGEKATLYITGDYAYGKGGYPPDIPPNFPLVFDVELKEFS